MILPQAQQTQLTGCAPFRRAVCLLLTHGHQGLRKKSGANRQAHKIKEELKRLSTTEA